jgi:hypothetical protein
MSVEWSVTGDVGVIDAKTGEFVAAREVAFGSPRTGAVVATYGKQTKEIPVRVELSEADIKRLNVSWPDGVDLQNVGPGQTIQFSAEGTDLLGNRSVGTRMALDCTWSCSPNLGTIDSETGLFKAVTTGDGENFTGRVTATHGSGPDMLTTSVDVRLALPADLSLDSLSFDFGELGKAETLTIDNLGSETLTWSITSDSPWLTATPASGEGPAEVTVEVDRTGLAGGGYEGTLTIESTGGDATIRCAMDVTTISLIIREAGGSQ